MSNLATLITQLIALLGVVALVLVRLKAIIDSLTNLHAKADMHTLQLDDATRPSPPAPSTEAILATMNEVQDAHGAVVIVPGTASRPILTPPQYVAIPGSQASAEFYNQEMKTLGQGKQP